MKQQGIIVERFFRPWGNAPGAHDDGFLPDIDSTYGKICCPKTVRLAEILKWQCLVLLGEPGIGKSKVMELRQRELGAHALAFDLRFDPSAAVLGSPEFLKWQHGQRALHLIIDSIDEADNPHFAKQFWGVLRKGPAKQLRLELACRSAEWPKVLEEQLPQFFQSDQFKYFQVEPLRRQDVATIAESRGVDANAFLEAIRRGGLGALASVPLTLRLLLDLFGSNSRLPTSQSEIYEAACLDMCRESSDTKAADPNQPDAVGKFERACEIAAVCILCRRTHLTESTISLQDAELSILDLARVIPTLDERAVRATLQTGLFFPRAPGNWEWFHQSFPEFLAARWLHRSSMNDAQLKQILLHPSDSQALTPQLKGLAAWLACMDSRVVRLLAEIAPERLVSLSSELLTDADREVATSTFFRRLENLETNEWLNRNECKRLHHPGLAAQLQVFLSNRTANMLVRRRAIHMAGVVGLAELEESLLSIALDATEESPVRVEAIDAVFDLPGDRAAAVECLKPLAEPNREDDPGEDIRGAVLERLWPNWLTAAELFRLLTWPRKASSNGRYRHIWHLLEQSLRERDLVEALAWVQRNVRPGRPDDFYVIERLSTSICRKALAHIENPAVRSRLAGVAIRVLRHALPLFGHELGQEPELEPELRRERMRVLVPAMALVSEDPESEAFWTVETHGEGPLVDQLDAKWLFDEWRSATGNARAFLATVIERLLQKSGSMEIPDVILAEIASAGESPLFGISRWIELGSTEAVIAKELLAKQSAPAPRANNW